MQHVGAEIPGVEERQRRLQADDGDIGMAFAGDVGNWPATRSWWPGKCSKVTSRARVVVQMPCNSDSTIPTATPCSIAAR